MYLQMETIQHMHGQQILICISHTSMLCLCMQHSLIQGVVTRRHEGGQYTPSCRFVLPSRESDLPVTSEASVSLHVYPESGAA